MHNLLHELEEICGTRVKVHLERCFNVLQEERDSFDDIFDPELHMAILERRVESRNKDFDSLYGILDNVQEAVVAAEYYQGDADAYISCV